MSFKDLILSLHTKNENGCWIWPKTPNSRGFARISFNGERKFVHRAAYEEFIGPIPRKMVVDHACGNRVCANPDHLTLVKFHDVGDYSQYIRSNSLPDENGCWIWQLSCAGGRYGKATVNYRNVRAHRLSYEQFCGPIADGLFVCHKCDEPKCVNPEHLFLGTSEDNIRDCMGKGRHTFGQRNGRAKLTERCVREIRNSKSSAKALSKKYGVSESRIYEAKSGRTWRHVL